MSAILQFKAVHILASVSIEKEAFFPKLVIMFVLIPANSAR
jgi:hypothetical protein